MGWAKGWCSAVMLLCLLGITGCVELRTLGKSNIDMVGDLHIQEMHALLDDLMEKLYKRNPGELAKKPGATISSRRAQIFDSGRKHLVFNELQRREEIAAMNLAFDPAFRGDRVFALIVGLTGMVRHSYEYNNELFMLDSLDVDTLYKSARNIEILAWKLQHHLQPDGRVYLVTSGTAGTIDNTSFDRLYGKMIAHQDMMALIIADKTNRTINSVVQSTASMLFLPI